MRTHPSLILALLLAPAACAGPVETRINAAGAGVAPQQALMWAPLPAGASAEVEQARTALANALQTQGYRIVDEAPLALSLGVSERPARIGLTMGQGAALSPAKEDRPLQSCDDRMLRLRVSIVDPVSGETRYSGAAEEAHCHATLTEALPRLARLAVADMASPAGARLVQSAGRD